MGIAIFTPFHTKALPFSIFVPNLPHTKHTLLLFLSCNSLPEKRRKTIPQSRCTTLAFTHSHIPYTIRIISISKIRKITPQAAILHIPNFPLLLEILMFAYTYSPIKTHSRPVIPYLNKVK